MTINLGEIFLAVLICTLITILFYMVSWYNYEEKDDENERKLSNTSNIQCLENEESILSSELNERLNFHSDGQIQKELNDLSRLEDEDLRSHVNNNHTQLDDDDDEYVNIETDKYDSVVHSDEKLGRLHLSIRYDDERSLLIVQILDVQDLIRSEQSYASEMCLTFTLIGPYSNDDFIEKHTRIIVANTAITWQDPMKFCITFENVTKHNLYVVASNKIDPVEPSDREISISLNSLDRHNEEINEWYDLQYAQSSY